MHYIQILLVLFAVISCTRQNVQKHFKLQDSVNQEPSMQINADLNDNITIDLSKAGNEQQKPKVIDNNIKAAAKPNSTSPASNKTSSPNAHKISKEVETSENKPLELESGALRRAILVFVAISFFFILYAGFKTYRGKKRDKSRVMVRKYGVRTKRSDLEMEPLPLSDDDEDETLFDLTTSRGLNQ